jgi:hypothetical protein
MRRQTFSGRGKAGQGTTRMTRPCRNILVYEMKKVKDPGTILQEIPASFPT